MPPGIAALENIFGTLPPLMAFKPQIGHTLGATAALETALLLSALKQGGSNDYQGVENSFSECAASQKAAFSVWSISLVLAAATHLWYGNGNRKS